MIIDEGLQYWVEKKNLTFANCPFSASEDCSWCPDTISFCSVLGILFSCPVFSSVPLRADFISQAMRKG